MFHDTAWNIFKDFVLLMWTYSPTHQVSSLGTNMPPRMFLNFCKGEPIGWCKHAPNGCFLSFLKRWGLDFPSSSQKVPIKSSCSHQVPIKILLFSWLRRIGRWARRSSVRLIGETPERLGQSAKQSTTVCGQAGRGATVAGRHPPAVQESRKSGFSACQVLWKIVGRSASHAALCRASSFMCATRELEPNGKIFPVHRSFIHHGVPVAGGSLWSIY